MISRLLFICVLTISSLSALVAPFYQSIRELDAILESEELEEHLGPSSPIVAIERNKTGYEIRTPTKILQVDLVYEVNEMPGPQQFHLIFR